MILTAKVRTGVAVGLPPVAFALYLLHAATTPLSARGYTSCYYIGTAYEPGTCVTTACSTGGQLCNSDGTFAGCPSC